MVEKTKKKLWQVILVGFEDGSVSWMYDKNVDRFKLLGHLMVEMEWIKEELTKGVTKKND